MVKRSDPINVSRTEAEESLADIQRMTQRTRHAIANSGAYITLIATGIVWLVGFLATQFLSGAIVGYFWTGAALLGGLLATILGIRIGPRLRSPSATAMARRASLFWLQLAFYGLAAIAIARPTDGKQLGAFIILFTMLGQSAMGLLLSYSSTWWALPVTALALIGYFLLPDIFYLWMAILGGGGMIALGLYVRSKW